MDGYGPQLYPTLSLCYYNSPYYRHISVVDVILDVDVIVVLVSFFPQS